jgi:hypothetical protein
MLPTESKVRSENERQKKNRIEGRAC